MTVKELRQKLFDVEDGDSKVLVSGGPGRGEVFELKNNDGPTVVILAEEGGKELLRSLIG